MRLRDYQELISKAIIITNNIKIALNNGSNSMYTIKNVQPFLEILDELKNAKIGENDIDKLFAIPNFKNNIEPEIIVNHSTENNFSSHKNGLLKTLMNLQPILKNILNEERPNALNIKLPEGYSSIKDYIDFFKDLNDACSAFKYIGTEVTITNFDVGSEWITLGGLTETGIGLFFALADKGLDLFNKVLESRKLISEIERNTAQEKGAKLEAINTTIDILNKHQKEDLEEYKTKLIEEALSESNVTIDGNGNENEFKNRLGVAIHKFGGLLIKGMEIVPALNAKPEVKQLSQKTDKNIKEKRKLIIGGDNLKYLTVLDAKINPKDIPADTIEIKDDENNL